MTVSSLSRRAFVVGGLAAGAWAAVAQSGLAADEVVLEEARSKYNHIVVAERGTVRTMYFVVDGTYYIESRLDRAHPQSLDLDYTRTMMSGFLVQPRPKRLLMIGFGGGQISNYLFEHVPDLEVDGVDIDADVIRLARKYFGVPNSPRYRTHAADGRLFVEKAGSDKWDMIILDAFRGVFVPLHLKTFEYYRTVLAHLTPTGVVAANLHANTEMYPHDRATFAAAFPQGYAFRSESGRQISYVASASSEVVGPYQMRKNAALVQSYFDFDLLGVASRYSLQRDTDAPTRIIHDDFKAGSTESAADRHNRGCKGDDCPYSTR